MATATATATPARPVRGVARLGLRLLESLATPHGVDRYLELLDPMLTVRELRAEVTEAGRSTDDTVTLTLRPTRQWRGFRAGQYVRITVLIDGVRHTRCYSPACSQHRDDGRIELTIKAHPEGLVSRYLHANATVGLVVGLSQAEGEFTLPDTRPAKVLLISGGSGITPVMSMLRTLTDEDYPGDITFLHYAYRDTDVAYRRELDAIAKAHRNVRIVYAYTDQPATGGLSGFFGQEHLERAAPWHAQAQTYLCGPPGLMKSVTGLFEANGLDDRLYTEQFAPPVIVVEPGEISGSTSFETAGVRSENTGATLLEQAEAAGLSPEFGCRMGICFTCTKVKTAGCTRNVRTGDLHSDPDQEIQLCISVPVGDVSIGL